MNKKIIKGVEEYYSGKIKEHGISSQGADWNSKESQYLRFEQLCRIIDFSNDYSILDFGCGYGELINFLESRTTLVKYIYTGFDISDEMISQANKHFGNKPDCTFTNTLPDRKSDYVIASGIFNVRLKLASDKEWLEYITDTLISLNEYSSKGFSFNALTSYSDKEFTKDYLYYSDPLVLFDFCKRNFSKNVALLHDYNLYEFTILVRK